MEGQAYRGAWPWQDCGNPYQCRGRRGVSHNGAVTSRAGIVHHAVRLVGSLAQSLVQTIPRTGSPTAVTHRRLPQNVACGFLALRSSDDDSQHSILLQSRIRQTELRTLERVLPLDSQERLPAHVALLTPATEHFAQFRAVCRRSQWSRHVTNSPLLALCAMAGSQAACKLSSACAHACR
jgi:hypothetical protein